MVEETVKQFFFGKNWFENNFIKPMILICCEKKKKKMKDKREITLEVYLERMAGVFLINDDELLMSKILRTDVVLSRIGEERTASTERVQEIKISDTTEE